jgi:uncharacterized protein (DUF3820 family)
MAEELHDDSPMPFGQHKGQPMEKVPVKYLHWLFHQGCNHIGVSKYIRENMTALMEEDEDLIWDKKRF